MENTVFIAEQKTLLFFVFALLCLCVLLYRVNVYCRFFIEDSAVNYFIHTKSLQWASGLNSVAPECDKQQFSTKPQTFYSTNKRTEGSPFTITLISRKSISPRAIMRPSQVYTPSSTFLIPLICRWLLSKILNRTGRADLGGGAPLVKIFLFDFQVIKINSSASLFFF